MANFIISPYAISFDSIKNALQSYINDKSKSSVVDTWTDFYTAGAGETILELDAAVAAFYAFHFIIGRREAYLPVAQNYSAILGGAETLGYSASRGRNLHAKLKIVPDKSQVITKWSVIGSYADYDIVLTDTAILNAGEETEINVVFGNSAAQSITISSSEVQQFTFTAENTTDDCRLLLNGDEVPSSTELKDAVNDNYIMLSNPYGSVDVLYLNGFVSAGNKNCSCDCDTCNDNKPKSKYKYATGDILYLQYIERNNLKFKSINKDNIALDITDAIDSIEVISDQQDVQSKDSIRMSASIYHETNNVVRARKDYAKFLKQNKNLGLLDTNDNDINPGLIAITYLRAADETGNSKLSKTEKETFMEEMVRICPDGVANIFIEDPLPVKKTLNITLSQKQGEVIPADVDKLIEEILDGYRNRLAPTLDLEVIEHELEKIPGVKVARADFGASEYQLNTKYRPYDVVEVKDILIGTEYQNWRMVCAGIQTHSGDYTPDWGSAQREGQTVSDSNLLWSREDKYVSSIPYRWKANSKFNRYSDVAVGYTIYPNCTSYTMPSWNLTSIVDGNVTFNRVKTYDSSLRYWMPEGRFSQDQYVLFNHEDKYAVYRVKETLYNTGKSAPDWGSAKNVNDTVDDNAVTWTMMYKGYQPATEYFAGNRIGILIGKKIYIYKAAKALDKDTIYYPAQKKGSEKVPFDGSDIIYDMREEVKITTTAEGETRTSTWVKGEIAWLLDDTIEDYNAWKAYTTFPVLTYTVGGGNIFRATNIANSTTGTEEWYQGDAIPTYTDNNIVWELDTYKVREDVFPINGTTWMPGTEYQVGDLITVSNGEYTYAYLVTYVTDNFITDDNVIFSVVNYIGTTSGEPVWGADNVQDNDILWTKTTNAATVQYAPYSQMEIGDIIETSAGNYVFSSVLGTSGSIQPNWAGINGNIVEDNNILWQKVGEVGEDVATVIELGWNEYLELDYTLSKIY